MIKQYCVRTYEINYSEYSDEPYAKENYETLNSYLNKGWKVVRVTPKSNYNEYIIEKEVEDSEVKE